MRWGYVLLTIALFGVLAAVVVGVSLAARRLFA